MVSCAAAGSAAHPSCIEISDPKLLAVIRTYAWKCMECKVRPAYRMPSVHQVLQHALFMSHRASLLTSCAVLSRALANHCLLLSGFRLHHRLKLGHANNNQKTSMNAVCSFPDLRGL
jgi:hypothetical protein